MSSIREFRKFTSARNPGRPSGPTFSFSEPSNRARTSTRCWTPGRALRLRDDFDLVIAGASGWASEKTLARLASRPPGVRYLGYVPEDELPGLTAGATRFRLSVALRRLRFSRGAGHGGGSAGDYIEHFVSAGNRGRWSAAGGSAQCRRNSSRHREAAHVAVAAATSCGRPGVATRAARVSLGRSARARAWSFSARVGSSYFAVPGATKKSHTCMFTLPSVYSTTAYSPGSSGFCGPDLEKLIAHLLAKGLHQVRFFARFLR